MYWDTGEAHYQKIPGRAGKISTPRNITLVKRTFTTHRTTSVRIASRKLQITRSTSLKIKVHDLGNRVCTKKKEPKYIKIQEQRAKTGFQKIYTKLLEKVLVVCDEIYEILDPSQIPGIKYFHARDLCLVKYDDQFKIVTKFHKEKNWFVKP